MGGLTFGFAATTPLNLFSSLALMSKYAVSPDFYISTTNLKIPMIASHFFSSIATIIGRR